MGDKSGIEWTDATWNPVRGCTKVSPGCLHCYAETFSERFRGVKGHAYERGFDIRTAPEMLDRPLRWTRPRRIFVNSMSDLFHPEVPTEYIGRVGDVMRRTPRHTYQVLTKRDARMKTLLNGPLWWMGELHNVWLGVSAEDRKHGLPRLEALRGTRAAVRFASVEPLLEDLGEINLTGIDWVIAGGESGAGARPMEETWVENVRRQCARQNVPFFFKQWGGVHKKSAGRTLNGRTWDAFPAAAGAGPRGA